MKKIEQNVRQKGSQIRKIRCWLLGQRRTRVMPRMMVKQEN